VDRITEAIVTIFSLIIGVAVLSVLVSGKARTSEVVQSVASGFGNDLAVAMSPVTGEHVSINTSYPGYNQGTGLPMMGGYGLPQFM
jgi:hypothetical protein